MPYLTQDALEALHFKSLGRNVKISDKASLYNTEQWEIGDNTRIDDFCVISGKIKMDSYVHIAAFCLIAGGEKGISIGDFSGVSYGSQIFSQSDDYSGQFMVSPLIPSQYKQEFKSGISIGRHVIIGASSVVLPGAHVADGCSIGAMTLVTKPTSPWGVYIGVPAKRIKDKSQNILVLEQQFLNSTV